MGEAVVRARRALPSAEIGVAVDPGRELAREVSRALRQVRAGASFVQTQLVFDVEAFRRLAQALRRTWPGARIVPMVMPLLTAAHAERVASLPGVRVPPWTAAVARRGAEEGWKHFRATLRGLAESELADRLAVMTYEADPDRVFVARLRAELERGWSAPPNSSSTASRKAPSAGGR